MPEIWTVKFETKLTVKGPEQSEVILTGGAEYPGVPKETAIKLQNIIPVELAGLVAKINAS